VFEALGIEGRSDRADPAVHHVARADRVSARLDVALRGLGQELEREVVHDLVPVHDPAVAVRGVFAQADVGQKHELGDLLAEGSQRPLHDSVLVVGSRARPVLLLGDAEEENGADPQSLSLLGFLAETVDGALRDTGQALERPLDSVARANEERKDKVAQVEARLAHELAQRRGAPEAAKPREGKRAAHASNLRMPTRAATAKARPRPASQALARRSAPQGSRS
jgi:hypothetical protein